VNFLAAIAAKTAVEDPEYLQRYVTEILVAREHLTAGLENLGVPYVPSQGNFVLMHVGPRSLEVRDRLLEQGILVRDRSYEIPGSVRVTVGNREQVQRFLDAFAPIWRSIQ
jgi:histidinol-phosphate aminotransferase